MSRLILVLLLFPTLVGAAPVVTSTGGTFAPDSLLTISGSSFGTKSPAAPYRYLDFEGGTVGGLIPDQASGGLWTIDDGPWSTAPRYSQDRQRIEGETVLFQNHGNLGYGNNSAFGLSGLDLSTLFFCGWSYRDDFTGIAEYSYQQKLFGNFENRWGSCDANDIYPNLRADSEWGMFFTGSSGKVRMYAKDYEVGDCGNTTDPMALAYMTREDTFQFDHWFRMTRFGTMGTAGGTDGLSYIRLHPDGGPPVERRQTGTFWVWDDGGYWTKFQIGHFFNAANAVTGQQDTGLKNYWSEVYFDTTPARVEIGDNPVYASCTHLEIQIPVSWSAGTITATCNTGTFQTGDNVYVFVFDSSDVTGPGDGPYTIAESYGLPENDPPAAPAGLSASPGPNTAILSWTANTEPDLAGYYVYKSTIQGGPYLLASGSIVTGTGFTNTGLTAGVTVYYVIKAADTSGNLSPYSNEAFTTPTGSATTTITRPDNLQVVE